MSFRESEYRSIAAFFLLTKEAPAEHGGGASSKISRCAGPPKWAFRAAARGHDRQAANGSDLC